MKKLLLFTVGLLASLFFGVVQAAPAFQAAGTSGAGTTTAAPLWPVHQIGDVALLFVESGNNDTPTVNAPSGFVAVPLSVVANNRSKLSVFWVRATSAAMPDPTVINTGGNHVYSQILTYRGVITTGNPWDVLNILANSSASSPITLPTLTTTVADTLIVNAAARESAGAGQFFGTVTNTIPIVITERSDSGTSLGSGGGFGVWAIALA